MPAVSVGPAWIGRSRRARIFKPPRRWLHMNSREQPRQRESVKMTSETLRTLSEPEKIESDSRSEPEMYPRGTLCLPHYARDTVISAGDDGYVEALQNYYQTHESNATERLVKLKAQLRNASTHEFWRIVMEELCAITGAQAGLVGKRVYVDETDHTIAMPDIGDPGSCVMAVTFYINAHGEKQLFRDYRYPAHGSPCAHMVHDKVLVIPERMHEFIRHNPNSMPWEKSEAFIGIPLFSGGQCFAHLALIWSCEGASQRKLGWTFIEMLLHSIEDIIVLRLEEGRTVGEGLLTQDGGEPLVPPPTEAPHHLKPHARGLSHELRTPMQGIVGMLDIMYTTVLNAIATTNSDMIRGVFEDLRRNIEVMQDSSRRAVEAADNVVHAYELNMQMPDTPKTSATNSSPASPSSSTSPGTTVASSSERSSQLGMKRPREDLLDIGPPLKKTLLAKRQAGSIDMNPGTSVAATNSDLLPDSAGILALTPEMLLDRKMTPRVSCTDLTEKARVNIGQKTNVGRVNQRLMHDIIRNSHPTSETRSITTECETIVVERRGSNGDVQHRTIKLMCSPDVPDNIIMNKQYLKFSLHKILDNAFKFTESGNITSSVRIDARRKMLEVSVEDTGCGITVESQQHLFEAHFQQDSAINRARDGLGLSLFNAKAQVRKYLGGDIVLERSSTFGRDKGSGFLMRLPMTIHQIDGHPAYFIGPSDLRTGVSTSILPELTAAPPLSTSSIPGTDRLCLSPSAASGTSKSSKKRRAYNPQLAKSYPLNFLVAEDNDIIRAIAISSLKKLGYDSKNITIAVDGVEAVNRYEASLSTPTQPRYTAILMDIWMPRVDGYEASRRIMKLAQQHGETTTIMAVTADITESCVERAKAAGMSGFLAKPYMLLDLECLIVDNFPHMGKPATET